MKKQRPTRYRVRFLCSAGEQEATVTAPRQIGYNVPDIVALQALISDQTGALSVVLLHWNEITDINQEGARAGLMNQPEKALMPVSPCPLFQNRPALNSQPARTSTLRQED